MLDSKVEDGHQVVPFQATHSQSDGLIGGEICIDLMPKAGGNISWFDSAELNKVQVNCAQLLKSWTNDEKKALYQVIIKQKQKLITIKEQTNKLEPVDIRYQKAMNEMTQSLEKKDKKICDLEQKIQKLQIENKELKTSKKSMAEEIKSCRIDFKTKEKEIKDLHKNIKDLNGEICCVKQKKDEAQQKLRVMEEVAGDVVVQEDSHRVVVSSLLEVENESKNEKLLGLQEEVNECRKVITRLQTEKAADEKQVKWMNESYKDIITNKEKTIELLAAITKENNVVNRYKMLLMHYKSELELKSIMDLKERTENEMCMLAEKKKEEEMAKSEEEVEENMPELEDVPVHLLGNQIQNNSKVFREDLSRKGNKDSGMNRMKPDPKLLNFIKEGLGGE